MTIFDDPMLRRFGTLDGDPVVYNLSEAWVHGNNGWYEVRARDMWSFLHKVWMRTEAEGRARLLKLPPLPQQAFSRL
jgi:hypothetical protein